MFENCTYSWSKGKQRNYEQIYKSINKVIDERAQEVRSMVLINIKIFNKFENLVILLSEQKFGDFGGGGDYIILIIKTNMHQNRFRIY